MEVLAKEMTEEIDWGIISDLLVMQGWTQVFTKRHEMDPDHSKALFTWIDEHIKHGYKFRREHWLFESEKDAMWFKLRWGSA